jgi:hypothetical protein
MSRDRSPTAEQVLSRVRASADPAPNVGRRVLASVEQRILLDPGGPEASAGGTSVAGDGSRASRIAIASHGSRAARAVGRLGRWGVFGLVAGTIGYQLGVSHERAAHEAAALAAVAVVDAISDGAPKPATALAPAGHESAMPAQASEMAPAAPSPPAATNASTVASRSRAGDTPPRPPRATSAHAPGRARPDEKPRAPVADAAQRLSMAEILERLQRAQQALHDSDPHAALAELDALDGLEHAGRLADERSVLRALALCDLRRVGDARQVLSKLEGRAAESIYRGRLEQDCAAALVP